MRALLLCVLLGFTLPAEASETDLSGVWVLDLKASGTMDEILEARGTPWILRVAVRAASVTQRIEQSSPATLTITIETALKSDVLDVQTDGVSRPAPGLDGPTPTRHSWDAGGALVTTADIQLVDGPGELTLVRSRSADGGTMNQIMRVTHSDGRSVSTLRVFRLEEGG